VDIMRIRRNKVVQVVVICLVCGAAFVFCVSQLAAVFHVPDKRRHRHSLHYRTYTMRNGQRGARSGDVDTRWIAGKLRSGVDITLQYFWL
jgi:hypothetical protein